MDAKQYNDTIGWTLRHSVKQSDDSLTTARVIFNNMGAALPAGDNKQVFKVLMTNDYMGWRSCSAEEAQESANKGVAAIAVSEDEIVVLAAETEGNDTIEGVAGTAAVMTATELSAVDEAADMMFYSYSNTTTNEDVVIEYPYVDIPQDGNIGTVISYMGYHKITNKESKQYKLKTHARNTGRYSISLPRYAALIDGRMVIATKENIGGKLKVAIGDYVQVRFRRDDGNTFDFDCIIGDFKGADAPNLWGHYNGQGVVEIVYHDYDPPEGYWENENNPWGSGRVLRITRVGEYGDFE